jgi:hypothetical protein
MGVSRLSKNAMDASGSRKADQVFFDRMYFKLILFKLRAFAGTLAFLSSARVPPAAPLL